MGHNSGWQLSTSSGYDPELWEHPDGVWVVIGYEGAGDTEVPDNFPDIRHLLSTDRGVVSYGECRAARQKANLNQQVPVRRTETVYADSLF